jgi:3-oxocholest-4-en-26-oate---CoA ligase
VLIPAAPLMHGTGVVAAFGALSSGGSVSTLVGRKFDSGELLDLIQTDHATIIAIVGDAFAKPILRALDDAPGKWDISSLRIITSSGAMWSQSVKQGLLAHSSQLILVDALGSSEAIGTAASVLKRDDAENGTAVFRPGPNTQVFTEDGRAVTPDGVELGILALRGRGPVGYHNDESKSARTFRVIDGERWTMTGDMATVDLDGSISLVGRGSQCINTAGEKVYPEEVEEILKRHPDVVDAAVVGVPDERFGEAVTALVSLQRDSNLDEHELIAAVRTQLAAYKAPKRVFQLPDLARSPNGKLDYTRLKEIATSETHTPS